MSFEASHNLFLQTQLSLKHSPVLAQGVLALTGEEQTLQQVFTGSDSVPHLGSSVRHGLFAVQFKASSRCRAWTCFLKLLVGPVAPHLNKLRMDFCSSQGYPIISRYSSKYPPEYIFESLLWSSAVVKTNRCFEFRENSRQVAVAR